jgi:hypothetical protein
MAALGPTAETDHCSFRRVRGAANGDTAWQIQRKSRVWTRYISRRQSFV